MRRYTVTIKTRLRDRAMAGVAARERNRLARAEAMRDVGGMVTDGILGTHIIRMLAYPGDEKAVAVTVDGVHKQARTMRGLTRCVSEMLWGKMKG